MDGRALELTLHSSSCRDIGHCSCSCRCEIFLSRNYRPFCSLSTSSMTTSLELCGSASQRDCGVFAAACPTAIQGAPPAGFYRCLLACHASLALPKHLMVERTHSVSLHTHAQDDVHAARRYSFASLIVQWVVLMGWTSGRILGLPFAPWGVRIEA